MWQASDTRVKLLRRAVAAGITPDVFQVLQGNHQVFTLKLVVKAVGIMMIANVVSLQVYPQ